MKKPRQRGQQPAGTPDAKAPLPEAAPGGKEEQARIAEILSELPEDLPKEVLVGLMQSMSFSGPMPPPAMLEEYERILPGSANRLLVCMEKEQDGRIGDNRKRVHTERIRVIGAIAVALSLIAVAAFAAYLGHPEIAIPLGLAGTLTGIVKAVMTGLEARKKS